MDQRCTRTSSAAHMKGALIPGGMVVTIGVAIHKVSQLLSASRAPGRGIHPLVYHTQFGVKSQCFCGLQARCRGVRFLLQNVIKFDNYRFLRPCKGLPAFCTYMPGKTTGYGIDTGGYPQYNGTGLGIIPQDIDGSEVLNTICAVFLHAVRKGERRYLCLGGTDRPRADSPPEAHDQEEKHEHYQHP